MPYVLRAIVLFTMVPIHEFSHAYAASRLGDDTQRLNGRLTLNPFAHLDLAGSILMFFVGFGWGRPVTIEVRKFKKPRRDVALTALAGPLSNLLASLFIVIMIKVIMCATPDRMVYSNTSILLNIFDIVCAISVNLAVFNLLPIPPLDGSKILGLLLPQKLYWGMLRYQRQITGVFMLLLFFGILDLPIWFLSSMVLGFFDYITRPVEWLMQLWI